MIKFSVDASGVRIPIARAASTAEKILAVQIMKDTEKFVPALTGNLSQRTHVEGSAIVYPGPYAKYLFYGKKMVNAKTGKGPMVIPGVGPRWPKGATLVATNEDLSFGKGMHPLATSHWIEASKAANMETWERVAGRLIENELN